MAKRTDEHAAKAPARRILVVGTADTKGEELAFIAARIRAAGGDPLVVDVGTGKPAGVSPDIANVQVDPWTAVVLMFHDHDWEVPIIDWALQTTAFYIGALGGQRTAASRRVLLGTRGWDDTALRRVEGPIGLFGPARDADTLALSVLTDLVARYHRNCSS